MAQVPDYNKIDVEKDSITVIRAKLEAISKDLRKRAEASTEEREDIANLLKKPLGEWP